MHHHKYLLQSVFSAHSTPSIISSIKGRGKAKEEVREEGNVAPHTFSVDNGLVDFNGDKISIDEFTNKLGSQADRQIIDDESKKRVSVFYYITPTIVTLIVLFFIILISNFIRIHVDGLIAYFIGSTYFICYPLHIICSVILFYLSSIFNFMVNKFSNASL